MIQRRSAGPRLRYQLDRNEAVLKERTETKTRVEALLAVAAHAVTSRKSGAEVYNGIAECISHA